MGCSTAFRFPRFNLELDLGGLELGLGSLTITLRRGILGLVLEGRLDALVELDRSYWAWGCGKRSTAPGWYEAWGPGLYFSLMTRPQLDARAASRIPLLESLPGLSGT